MTDLVLLVGPMSASQLGTVAWQRPTKVVTLNSGPPGYSDQDGTIGPGAFAALWDAYGSVEAVAAAHGVEDLGAVGLIAFSAGWAFADRALDSGRVDGALLLDACFAPAPGFSTLVKPGYASFAQKAATGQRLLVMTGGQGGRYHTGAACVWAQAGTVDTTWESWAPLTSVAPTKAMRTGTFFVAEYPASVTHGGHVTTLGRALANDMLAPWLAGGRRGGSGLWGALAVALAAGTAGVVFSLLR